MTQISDAIMDFVELVFSGEIHPHPCLVTYKGDVAYVLVMASELDELRAMLNENPIPFKTIIPVVVMDAEPENPPRKEWVRLSDEGINMMFGRNKSAKGVLPADFTAEQFNFFGPAIEAVREL